MQRRITGFTLVELVVVIVLLGIITAYVAPKFSGRGGYDELTSQQDIKQSIRFAQQLAMSRTDHTITFVTVTSTTPQQIDVRQDGATIGGSDPPYRYPKNMADNISLGSATTLIFNRLGATTDATISVTGPMQTLSVSVTGSTGYAR